MAAGLVTGAMGNTGVPSLGSSYAALEQTALEVSLQHLPSSLSLHASTMECPMSHSCKSLFDPVVPGPKLHKTFEHLRTYAGAEPARKMLDEVYRDFNDPEGNFVEQFQTTGFDARIFELYLFAYFTRSGFKVERRHVNPDFIVERNGLRVAVEATTVNPPTSGVMNTAGTTILDLTTEELRDYCRNEFPIRLGSPLFSKLNKRYWDFDHCRGLPFVIAIEAFHDANALALSDSGLVSYLYGMEHFANWSAAGRLNVTATGIREHKLGDKVVPAGFFSQPHSEHISAVAFTNSGTFPKFARMGYQNGIGCDTINMTRVGYCFNPDPDAMDPTFFSYNLDQPPLVESWGQGLVVLHNPHCVHPVPHEYFVDAVQGYVKDERFLTDHVGWHPISSRTIIMHLGEVKKQLASILAALAPRIVIAAVSKTEFQQTCGLVHDDSPVIDEQGWFEDETGAFLGVVFRDKVDNDWGYTVLARDQYFTFRSINCRTSIQSRDKALIELQTQMARYLSSPQRVFPQ